MNIENKIIDLQNEITNLQEKKKEIEINNFIYMKIDITQLKNQQGKFPTKDKHGLFYKSQDNPYRCASL